MPRPARTPVNTVKFNYRPLPTRQRILRPAASDAMTRRSTRASAYGRINGGLSSLGAKELEVPDDPGSGGSAQHLGMAACQ